MIFDSDQTLGKHKINVVLFVSYVAQFVVLKCLVPDTFPLYQYIFIKMCQYSLPNNLKLC